MLRSVALVRADVSEECSTTIIKATRNGELGTTLAVTINRSTLHASIASYVPTLLPNVGCNIPEDGILHSLRRENLKSYIALTSWTL
jgi:hypothetical protein